MRGPEGEGEGRERGQVEGMRVGIAHPLFLAQKLHCMFDHVWHDLEDCCMTNAVKVFCGLRKRPHPRQSLSSRPISALFRDYWSQLAILNNPTGIPCFE